MADTNRHLVLVERPRSAVEAQHFELRTGPVPTPGPGEILVRTVWLGFDPTQRGWLNDVKSYMPPVAIGETMRSTGIGQVIATNNPDFAVGDWVQGMVGWQEYACLAPKGPMRATKVPAGVDPKAMLSIYGTTGLTAYFGLIDIGKPVEGETLFVSGAAGSTGSIVGQIGKILGLRVIGSAGSPEKCEWVTGVAGFDECISYRTDNQTKRLRELAPKGIDVFFDNVGGPTLEAALDNLALHARIALCGGISSGYTAESLPPGPKNYMQLVIMRARMEGFLLLDFAPRFGEAIQKLSGWVNEGRITYAEDIQEGLENAPTTLNRLFSGQNLGKQLLKVADPV
jgi:hypothetical protein